MENKFSPHIHFEACCCPMGCMEGDDFILRGKDRLQGLPGLFKIVKCRNCGLMRTNPRPAPDAMHFYYPDDYGPYQGTKVIARSDQIKKKKTWKRILSRIFQFNVMRMPQIQPGVMLEFGCASGAFLHRMALEGWKVHGIEFSKNAAENALRLGYHVQIGGLETIPSPNVYYDLIVGWMVLEHLHDPVLSLKKLYKWTKPGGYLVLSVPNAGSFEFRIFRSAWYALHLPNHLYHFTPETISNLLKKCGWTLCKIHHQRVIGDLFASIGNKLEDRTTRNKFIDWLINFPRTAGKINYALYPLGLILGTLKQSGRMTIWAKKKP